MIAEGSSIQPEAGEPTQGLLVSTHDIMRACDTQPTAVVRRERLSALNEAGVMERTELGSSGLPAYPHASTISAGPPGLPPHDWEL